MLHKSSARRVKNIRVQSSPVSSPGPGPERSRAPRGPGVTTEAPRGHTRPDWHKGPPERAAATGPGPRGLVALGAHMEGPGVPRLIIGARILNQARFPLLPTRQRRYGASKPNILTRKWVKMAPISATEKDNLGRFSTGARALAPQNSQLLGARGV